MHSKPVHTNTFLVVGPAKINMVLVILILKTWWTVHFFFRLFFIYRNQCENERFRRKVRIAHITQIARNNAKQHEFYGKFTGNSRHFFIFIFLKVMQASHENQVICFCLRDWAAYSSKSLKRLQYLVEV